jgi:MFS family permease
MAIDSHLFEPDHEGSASAWGPLMQPVFRALWTASVASNIGTWMQNTAAAWLMTSIAPSPVMVALVQTATSLPIFLLALPAGALADVIDRRRLILFTQMWMLLAAALLGVLTLAGCTTPWVLLTLTLLLGIGSALNAPAWQAIVPELVTRQQLPAAVSLNSAGFNMARAVGPALGGLVVGWAGAGTAFLINAASFLAVVGVLYLWQRPPRESTLPAERILGAMRTGMRYVRHAPALRTIMLRATAFIVCASAQLSLLPLLVRREMSVGSVGYGIALGCFGAGAVLGAALLPRIRRTLEMEHLVTVNTLVFAATLFAMAWLRNFVLLCMALFIAGTAWLALLSSYNSSVQASVPSWVRGRALAVYMLVFFGGMAAGSTLAGAAAALVGTPRTLLGAGGGLILGLLLTARYRLAATERIDLRPSPHWGSPNLAFEPRPDTGPVLILVEYQIDPERSRDFTLAMRRLRNTRLRDGAIRWDLFVDAASPQRYVESFVVESWLDHLRQHERITVADREVEELVRAFHRGDGPPLVTHLLAQNLPKRS